MIRFQRREIFDSAMENKGLVWHWSGIPPLTNLDRAQIASGHGSRHSLPLSALSMSHTLPDTEQVNWKNWMCEWMLFSIFASGFHFPSSCDAQSHGLKINWQPLACYLQFGPSLIHSFSRSAHKHSPFFLPLFPLSLIYRFILVLFLSFPSNSVS